MKKVLLMAVAIVATAVEVSAALIDRATDFIAREEGFRSTPYTCPGGQRTIGYGCAEPSVVAKGTITREEARSVLRSRVEEEIKWIRTRIPHLNENQLIAVCSLRYNIGKTRFVNSKAYQYLRAGKLLRAVDEMSQFRLVDGKINQGLVERRTRERNMFLSPYTK